MFNEILETRQEPKEQLLTTLSPAIMEADNLRVLE